MTMPRVKVEVRLDRWASEAVATEVAALIEGIDGVHTATVVDRPEHITEFDPCPCGCEGS